MNDTPQHTPTPWTVLCDDYTGERFLSAGGFAVPSEPFRDSDLDFIVRAVNAYEPMREALANIAIAPCISALLGEEIEPGSVCGCPGCRARAVLALAEKE